MSEPGGTRAVVEAFVDALNRHDVDAAVGAVTDDYISEHTSSLGTSLNGKDAFRERLPQFLGQFRDLHYDVEEWIVDGDSAAVPYRLSCQYVGDDGVAHPVTMRGMFRFLVRDGLVARRVDYWDGNRFLRQIENS